MQRESDSWIGAVNGEGEYNEGALDARRAHLKGLQAFCVLLTRSSSAQWYVSLEVTVLLWCTPMSKFCPVTRESTVLPKHLYGIDTYILQWNDGIRPPRAVLDLF